MKKGRFRRSAVSESFSILKREKEFKRKVTINGV